MATNYDVHQKLEAVERAIAICKRVAPSMIAKGNITQGQVSNLLNTMKQVVFDYHSQVLEMRKTTAGGCSSLNDSARSDNFTSRSVD
jgi:hypothetical protein